MGCCKGCLGDQVRLLLDCFHISQADGATETKNSEVSEIFLGKDEVYDPEFGPWTKSTEAEAESDQTDTNEIGNMGCNDSFKVPALGPPSNEFNVRPLEKALNFLTRLIPPGRAENLSSTALASKWCTNQSH